MGYIHLSDASFSEVLARVAFQLIKRDYLKRPASYEHPPAAMVHLSGRLTKAGWWTMGTWVFAYAQQWSEWAPIGLIRERMVFQSRSGLSWRRIVHPDYKGTRRADPRVTNRGVSSDDHPRDEQ